LLAPRPTPSWRTTPCRLSTTVYSIYSQLPPHIRGRSSIRKPEDAPCRGDRNPLIAWSDRTTPCRLSATAYSIYSELPSDVFHQKLILETLKDQSILAWGLFLCHHIKFISISPCVNYYIICVIQWLRNRMKKPVSPMLKTQPGFR
jgi:hypothetical protein